MSNDPTMVKWTKKDGTKVEINDSPANIAKAKELGWNPAKQTAAEKKALKDAEVEAELQAQIAAEEAAKENES